MLLLLYEVINMRYDFFCLLFYPLVISLWIKFFCYYPYIVIFLLVLT